MISDIPRLSDDSVAEEAQPAPKCVLLARYGSMPQTARFGCEDDFPVRGCRMVVTTDRGTELAEVLEVLPHRADQSLTGTVVREASADDLALAERQTQEANQQFAEWRQRIQHWKLQLELVDLEWTLDHKLILYVLNDRGAETTRLALLSAAQGPGIIHVQPVSAEGVVLAEQGGGCGSCGCSPH